ncbi:hypothetical protein [Acinetobacter sp.]|uniref:hypothetical protein n=1 Tax=Acinetobacter sp. TaxID=472 RepID=UPI00388F34EE
MNEFIAATSTETVSGKMIDLANPRVEDIDVKDIAWALSRLNRYVGHTLSRLPYTVAQHSVEVSHYIEQMLTPGTELNGMFYRFCDEKANSLLILNPHELVKENAEDSEFDFWADCVSRVRGQDVDENKRIMITFHGLLHDFHEAYLTDIPTPVKRLPGIYEAYSAAEKKMDAVIFKALKLGYADKWPADRAFGEVVVKWADLFALKIEAYHLMHSRGLTWNLPNETPSIDIFRAFKDPIDGETAYHKLLARYDQLKPKDPYYD